MIGILIPTCRGEEYVIPILGPYGGDLQELYRVARKYFSNFDQLASACYSCTIPGWSLNDNRGHFPLFNIEETDSAINSAINMILNGNRAQSAAAKQQLKQKCL